jgi:F0F1-type ATP synthase membrane subunit c/vacuolar-type H+-ATPase subunit K
MRKVGLFGSGIIAKTLAMLGVSQGCAKAGGTTHSSCCETPSAQPLPTYN